MKFPEIKKKVNSFLLDEEGRISKKNMIVTGVVLGGAALSLMQGVSAEGYTDQHNTIHDNSLDTMNEVIGGKTVGVQGFHNHHLSHASHHIHSSY